MSRVPASARPPQGARPDVRRRLVGRVVLAGVLQAFVVVLVLHRRHDEIGQAGEAVYLDPVAHWTRDSLLYAPVAVLLLLVATLAARRLVGGLRLADGGVGAVLLWSGLGAALYAAASVPAAVVHAQLFGAGHGHGGAGLPQFLPAAQEAIFTMRYSFALLLVYCLAVGLPWATQRRAMTRAPIATPTGRDH